MTDYIDSLERLAGLFQKGALSKEEFEAEKARLLDQQRSSAVQVSERNILGIERKKFFIVAGSVSIVLLALSSLIWWLTNDGALKQVPTSNEVSAKPISSADDAPATVSFSDLSKCQPGAEFAQLLGRIRSVSALNPDGGGTIRFQGTSADREVAVGQAEFSGQQVQMASADVQAQWLNLHVMSARTFSWDNGSAISVILSDAPETSRNAINEAAGTKLKVGEVAIENDALFVVAATAAGGSMFTCVRAPKSDSEGGSDVPKVN